MIAPRPWILQIIEQFRQAHGIPQRKRYMDVERAGCIGPRGERRSH